MESVKYAGITMRPRGTRPNGVGVVRETEGKGISRLRRGLGEGGPRCCASVSNKSSTMTAVGKVVINSNNKPGTRWGTLLHLFVPCQLSLQTQRDGLCFSHLQGVDGLEQNKWVRTKLCLRLLYLAFSPLSLLCTS